MNAVQMAPTEILRWVECEECGGEWRQTTRYGETRNPGQGPTTMPLESESECPYCTEGYVQVDESDTRWDAGTLAHPHD